MAKQRGAQGLRVPSAPTRVCPASGPRAADSHPAFPEPCWGRRAQENGVEHVTQSWLACLDLSLQAKPQCSRTRETRAAPNVFWSLTLSRAESVLSTPPHPHSVCHTLCEPPHQAQATAKGGLSGCRKVLPHPQLVTTAHKVWSQTLMIWDLANASHLHQCGTSFKATGDKL